MNVYLFIALLSLCNSISIGADRFRTRTLDVPSDNPFCALESGEDRKILVFDVNIENDEVSAIRAVSIPWSLECDVLTRNGTFHPPCLNDECGDRSMFFSCATSGLSPGCGTKIPIETCDGIDVTGASDCHLALGGADYDLSEVKPEDAQFVPKFILSFSVFGGLSVLAFCA